MPNIILFLYFCKWLINDHNIVVCGIETNFLTKELEKLNVKVRKPFEIPFFKKKFQIFTSYQFR